MLKLNILADFNAFIYQSLLRLTIHSTEVQKFLHIPSGRAHNLTSDTMMQALVFLVSKSGTCVHITKRLLR